MEYQLYSALIDARNKDGLSQAELAKMMDRTQSALSRFESRRGNPTIEFIEKLSKALGVALTIRVSKST